MGLLSLFKSIYNLDTLDTRFTTNSATPYQTVIESRSDTDYESEPKLQKGSKPPKWRTTEFYFYYVVIAFLVPYMFWVTYKVSRPDHPQYYKYSQYLSDGWLFGRKIDNTDAQYRIFRTNLPFMAILLIAHPMLRKAWNSIRPIGKRGNHGHNRLDQRASFDFAFAILYLLVLHGFSAFKVLLILYMNYSLATRLPRKYIPFVTWTFNISVLFANELCSGYRFDWVAWHLGATSWMGVGRWLDSYSGLITRWEVLFNITILRLVSFNLDYYWSKDKNGSNSIEKKQLDEATLSERDRVAISADPKDYSFRNYVAYAIYGPTYLAGPIVTFNDYISQCKYRSATIENTRTFRYAIRFVLVLLAMEFVLHFDYIGAITKASPVWSDYSAQQLSLLSFMNLHIIWLKLLLPWRLFRLWALIDGIDPPENMVRCVSNNYSTQLFWRSWHRSYNRWLVRYIYVPLGGTSFRSWRQTIRSVITFLLTFTFVALWHDIKLRLLIWGWLIVLFMVPEWLAKALFPTRNWENHPTSYRMICCMGAVANCLMMISANLVGFAVGWDGLQAIVGHIVHEWSGILFMVVACLSFFVGIQVMFEIREEEERKGVVVKC